MPVADPDSSIQPNKEGGYAPNYTPMAATDGQNGFIVDSDVLDNSDEGRATLATVDRVEQTFGEKPKQLLADSAYGGGENLAGLSEREVDAYIPQEQREDSDENPARRADPYEPVAEGDWSKLPHNRRTGNLGRHAFVFDSSEDCYYCPMGRRLEFIGLKHKTRRHGKRIEYRVYRCGGCVGCPLSGECLSPKVNFREVLRDAHEGFREAMDVRMRSNEGKEVYARRKWIAETPFGVLKSSMGLRRFLLRGLENVKTEWLWACTAFNLSKLVREVASLRVRFAVCIG